MSMPPFNELTACDVNSFAFGAQSQNLSFPDRYHKYAVSCASILMKLIISFFRLQTHFSGSCSCWMMLLCGCIASNDTAHMILFIAVPSSSITISNKITARISPRKAQKSAEPASRGKICHERLLLIRRPLHVVSRSASPAYSIHDIQALTWEMNGRLDRLATRNQARSSG